ncbi:MAG TPA: 2-amino-4-hydroxy-6-hydroxymethyldihydropteridine diphosphokinase [Gemmatimonadaceae bacterium]|jgi:2-amino-4-hydroxy-6-hydroxymethyldihydropteridine diphosphokinase
MRKSSYGATPVSDVAFIALGSNLGDRHAYLSRARWALDALPASRIVAESTIEETAPLGPADQPAYLNQMVALETTLEPHALLTSLLEIEQREGRQRDVRWGPRTLDLDIVAYRDATVNDEDLQVPHRELPNRDFWQRELAELRSIIA